MNAPSQSVQVLIVDDNPTIRELMCRGMESHCSVTSSSDGADALLKSIDNPPDLMLDNLAELPAHLTNGSEVRS